jgi:hypothetical protein
LTVCSIELDPTGTMRVLVGKPGKDTPDDADVEQWLSKHHANKRKGTALDRCHARRRPHQNLLVCVARRPAAGWRLWLAGVYCQLQCCYRHQGRRSRGPAAELRIFVACATRADYVGLIIKIEQKFGDAPIKALADPRTRGVFLEWCDQLALRSQRQADYAWTVLAWAKDRGKITVNPCERGGRVYHGTRVDFVWTRTRPRFSNMRRRSCTCRCCLRCGPANGRAICCAFPGRPMPAIRFGCGNRFVSSMGTGSPLHGATCRVHGHPKIKRVSQNSFSSGGSLVAHLRRTWR